MTRKERNIDNFIESARDDNILSNLGENDQNLNISSISRLEESTPSKKQAISEDEKTDRELENSDRKISRQPTFSSFTPQPKDEKEYCQRKVAQLYEDKENGSEGRAGRNHSYQEGMLKPLLLSLSGTNYNPEEVSHNGFNGNNFRPESCIKSSEGTYPQFFISSDTKNLNVSSEGSRKYRSPTFEAISEEENNRSHCMIDSPTHKRLCMDVDYPEKFVVNRASRRPPSIHAALSPDISLTEREIISQNPKILIAHYENVISSLRKDYEEMYNRNGGLERQVDRLKTQLSDSNKLLLKLQEEKEADKIKFLETLRRLSKKSDTRNNPETSSLKKCFTLEMSSNRTSEDDLHRSGNNNNHSSKQTLNNHDDYDLISPLTLSNNLSPRGSSRLDSHNDDIKLKLFKAQASVKQKEEQIYTLKSINQNLQAELKNSKDLEEQTRTELIQHKQRRKDCEVSLKELRIEKGQDKITIRRLNNEKENLITELDEMKENYNFLQNDFNETKQENEKLKSKNTLLEKDKHILQCNIDKLNRMLNKATADSKRYKSVVDLQKSAMNDLQKDYNKVIIDLSHNGSVTGEKMYGMYSDIQVKNFRGSMELEPHNFSNTMVDNRTNNSSPHIHEATNFHSLSETRNALNPSQLSKGRSSLFNDYSNAKDVSRRFHNLSNNFGDIAKEEQSELLPKDHNMMERTFDHEIRNNQLEHREHISMTAGQHSKRGIILKYIPKLRENISACPLESKRMSTEQLIEISPGNCSPEMVTDQSESFISNSTVMNSPDINPCSDQRTTQKMNNSSKRTRSRRDSRILIQPLPRLYTQSKYQGFRQAKSTERRECFTVRNKMISSRSQYPSPKENIIDRFTKDSTQKNDCPTSFSSSIRSPQTTTTKVAKYSQIEISYSNDKNSNYKNSRKSSNRDSISSLQSRGPKFGGKVVKGGKSAILYPSVNPKTTMEVVNDCSRESQLRTLTQHLNVISERKCKLQTELIMIDRLLNQNKKQFTKTNLSRNSAASVYKTNKSEKNSSLQAAEALMNKRRKGELERELDALTKSINNVKARIKNQMDK